MARRFPGVWRFSLLVFFALLVGGLSVAHQLREQLQRRTVHQAEQSAGLVVDLGVWPTLIDPARLQRPLTPQATQRLRASLHPAIADGQLGAVYLWSANRQLRFASDAHPGADSPADGDLARALAGTPTVSFSDPTGGRFAQPMARILLPLQPAGSRRPVGAAEVLLPRRPLTAEIAREARQLYVGLFALLGLFCFGLSSFARHARLREQQANHDALTGLFNRSVLQARTQGALARAASVERKVAVLFCDLDGFKTINDSLGHAAGDQLLVAVAARLEACLRSQELVARIASERPDTVTRLGGDEFAILLEAVADDGVAAAVAERIVAVLAEPFTVADREVRVGASIGIATSGGEHTSQELLRDADAAMYAAKADGKGGWRLFEPAMHTQAVDRLELYADLRGAADRGELLLHYQPILDLQTGAVEAVEALLRWQHPTRGLLGPATFLPMAEDSGLIVPIGRWVLAQACQQLRTWQQQFPHAEAVAVSVNLAARQLADPHLVDDVRGVLDETQLAPERLILELTETALVDDGHDSVRRLAQLKQLGVRLAIDDFGAGYSSLAYLRRFPIDLLKLDRSFLHADPASPADTDLVPAIISLARTLRLRTVAEGIEQPEQLAQLQAIGCQAGQGYLLSRPLTAQATEQLLSDLQHGQPPAAVQAYWHAGHTTPTFPLGRQAEVAAS